MRARRALVGAPAKRVAVTSAMRTEPPERTPDGLLGSGDLELTRLWRGLLRRWPRIAIATLLVGGICALWVLAQPPLYATEATLEIAAPSTAPAVREVEVAGSGASRADQALGLGQGDAASSLAPPTDADGAGSGTGWAATLREEQSTAAATGAPMNRKDIPALLETAVFNAAVSTLIREDPTLSSGQRRTLLTHLGAVGGVGRGGWLRMEGEDSGVVRLQVRTPDPALSVALARAVAQALEDWDRRRVVRALDTLQQSLSAQLREVDRQLEVPGLAAPVRRSLLGARSNFETGLAITRVRAQGAVGSVQRVPGVPRAEEVKLTTRLPAAVALVVATFLLALAVAAVRAARDRRLFDGEPLRAAGLPVLAELAPGRSGRVHPAHAVGFAAARLLSKPVPGGIIVLTSPRAWSGGPALGDGLAAALTRAGRRVLVVEAEIARPSQNRTPPTPEVLPNPGAGPTLTLWDALNAPAGAELRVQAVSGVPSRLAAGAVPAASLTEVPHGRLGEVLRTLGQQFDDVLVNCPGLLEVPDALTFARHADHLVVAVQAGRSTLGEVHESVRLSELGRLPAPDFLVDGTVGRSPLPTPQTPA